MALAAKKVSADPDWVAKLYKDIGENDTNQDVRDFLSTGYLPLNWALSNKYDGGIPVGRMTEIFGAASSGKTLLATMALIETQRKDNGLAMLLDFEHAFSVSRAQSLGLSVDKSQWIFRQPETAEQGFVLLQKVVEMVRAADPNKYVTIVVDSVASMVTEAELEAGYTEQNMKTRLSLAVVLSGALKQLAGLVNSSNITLIFLNQTRDNPGIMFGDKTSTPGGNAMKFYCSTRIKLNKIGKIKDGSAADAEVIGEQVRAEVIKNKVAMPFRKVEYQGSFTEGINLVGSHIAALDDKGLLGDTKGYRELDGKKYREKELEALCRSDAAVYLKLLDLFSKKVK